MAGGQCPDVWPGLDTWTDRRPAWSCPSTTTTFSTSRLGPYILKAGDRQVTKMQVRAPPHLRGPQGLHTPKCWEAQEASRGSAWLRPLSQPSSSAERGAVPTWGLSGRGCHPELRGRGCSWGEGDRSRQLPVGNRNYQVLPARPPSQSHPETAGPTVLQPSLRPRMRTAGPRLSARGPSEPPRTPSLSPGTRF